MSKWQVDEITDSAGTGKPDFSNGLSKKVTDFALVKYLADVSSFTSTNGGNADFVFDDVIASETVGYNVGNGEFTFNSTGLYVLEGQIAMFRNNNSEIDRVQLRVDGTHTGSPVIISADGADTSRFEMMIPVKYYFSVTTSSETLKLNAIVNTSGVGDNVIGVNAIRTRIMLKKLGDL